MTDLIDRHALLRMVFDNPPEKAAMTHAEWARKCIFEVPTIEAEPVRHGRLVEGKTFNDQRCSECGQVFRDDICFIYPADGSGIGRIPKRCPECGCYWNGGPCNEQ